MTASLADRNSIPANTTKDYHRVGTVVAVLGEDGPPYRVRFDSGEETIVSPGPDATIEPGSVGDKLGAVGQRAEETLSEAADVARQKAEEATGAAARTVADVAESVAKRFER